MSASRAQRKVASVAKVIAVPELLENILIIVGEDAIPATELFVLQRVSKNFGDTIQGFVKLRRLMCLSRYDVGDPSFMKDQVPHPLISTLWFLRMLDLVAAPDIDNKHIAVYDALGNRQFRSLDDTRNTIAEQDVGKCASWRAMHMYCFAMPSRSAKPIDEQWRVENIFVDFQVEIVMDRAVERQHELRWVFSADANLGTLFDRYCYFMEAFKDNVDDIEAVQALMQRLHARIARRVADFSD